MSARAILCKGCWQNMRLPIALRGVGSVPFRAVGIRPSRMNPNTCTICEMMFERVMKARQVEIDATILFADLRGYTSLSRSQSSSAISELLDAFYDECAEAIWEGDGIVNKTMGDAVMAVFNFPIGRGDHATQAVRTARTIQERWRVRRERLSHLFGAESASIGVGVGVNTGKVSFGEFGRAHHDLTAIGTVVNVAARAQSAAAADEILVTEAVHQQAIGEFPESTARDYQLKGIDEPARLWAA
jgi:class 3 adenylate cyclase